MSQELLAKLKWLEGYEPVFNYLEKLDNSIMTRYQTLERNVRSKSNSFYDSYLDLLESTIKRILEEESIPFDDTRTCGYLLKEETTKVFFKEKIMIDDYSYGKLLDYTLKINRHKHKNEKYVTIEAVINYLRIYYNLTSQYFKFKEFHCIESFDADFFNNIFGITIRENNELKIELNRMREELQKSIEEKNVSIQDIEIFRTILNAKENETLAMDEQNQELRNQLNKLKDIKLNSIEEKMNKTINLLLDLQSYIAESRAVSLGVGLTITDKTDLDRRIEKARMMLEEEHRGRK